MRIEELELNNFRNIENLKLEPNQSINVFYGDNGQGKTNILEAIYLLTGQRSFRQTKENDYIRFGSESTEITAKFWQGGRSQSAKLIFLKGNKQAWINGIQSQPSELTGLFCAVVFSPSELTLIKEGPAYRRCFMDNAISQVMPRYINMLQTFNRILSQRNNLLYDMTKNAGLDDLLEVWDRSYAKAAFSIMHARARYIKRLIPQAQKFYREISGGREKLDIEYEAAISGNINWADISDAEGENYIISELKNNLTDDLKNGFSTKGPHRDDLDITVNEVSARSFGSQGQQRSCALALKLAECSILEEVTGEKPLLLLDDVLSELDKKRRDVLLSGINGGQLFLTSCDRTGLKTISDGLTSRVKEGRLSSLKTVKAKK